MDAIHRDFFKKIITLFEQTQEDDQQAQPKETKVEQEGNGHSEDNEHKEIEDGEKDEENIEEEYSVKQDEIQESEKKMVCSVCETKIYCHCQEEQKINKYFQTCRMCMRNVFPQVEQMYIGKEQVDLHLCSRACKQKLLKDVKIKEEQNEDLLFQQ